MSEAADGAAPSRPAWQPFTFGGLAAFAQATLGRLVLVELVMALLVSASIVYFLHDAYFPVIVQGIQAMPESAKIADGHLVGVDATLIAETKFLAIAVTPERSSQIGQSADVQMQLRPSNFRVGSVFLPDWGWEFDYQLGTTLELSRSALEPWWGAWHPVFLALTGVAMVVFLFGIWAMVALVYTLPVKLFAWFADRQLSLGGAWRLCSAALLPGAFFMGIGVLLYAWQGVDLIGLAFFVVAHLLIGWVYVIGSIWACPRIYLDGIKRNPFIS